MFSVASSSAALSSAFTDVGVLIGVGVAAVLVGWAALVGLGFGVRAVKKYLTGKKF